MKKVPSGNLLLMTETSQQLCSVSVPHNYLDLGHKFGSVGAIGQSVSSGSNRSMYVV